MTAVVGFEKMREFSEFLRGTVASKESVTAKEGRRKRGKLRSGNKAKATVILNPR
ncbi:MAG: hypothetical protein LBQ52_02845 [Helicobacteraceae bacterium]|jgi:hypothetical protein|nr:hypothetical protein [Helicobacteraceae bacterium]